MSNIFDDFKEGQKIGSGARLAASLSPVATAEYPDRLKSFYYFSNAVHVSADLRYSLFQANGLRLPKQEQNSWVDIFTAYWKAVGEIVRFDDSPRHASWVKVFDAWKDTANQLIRGYSTGSLQAWTVPCLYSVGRYLRAFAMKADAELSAQDSVTFDDRFQDDATDAKNPKLEEATRVLNRMFTLCLSDRLILTYLVPCHLVTTHTLPSKKLLAPFPRVEKLFRPLCDCIKKGDLGGFDAAMTAGEEEFVKRRIYLPLERGRDIALRNLFRKVFIAGGFDEPKEGQPPIRRTRVPVAEFAAALRIGTHADDRSRVDIDEVECLLSNLIYKQRWHRIPWNGGLALLSSVIASSVTAYHTYRTVSGHQYTIARRALPESLQDHGYGRDVCSAGQPVLHALQQAFEQLPCNMHIIDDRLQDPYLQRRWYMNGRYARSCKSYNRL
ncbi:COP9 signalosome complex subunit [Aspergillus luchuensis]|uniref:COP9 signalosome complex subunit n=1 Tax=Aspergillus kawachii TaxID=1069201 RepID=A0A146FQD8_ASPKA|nr:COP9 signalosome complex subunit [Aspergillus luchuensis]